MEKSKCSQEAQDDNERHFSDLGKKFGKAVGKAAQDLYNANLTAAQSFVVSQQSIKDPLSTLDDFAFNNFIAPPLEIALASAEKIISTVQEPIRKIGLLTGKCPDTRTMSESLNEQLADWRQAIDEGQEGLATNVRNREKDAEKAAKMIATIALIPTLISTKEI